MIGIYPGKIKMKELQEKHWGWFKTKLLENWINKMKSKAEFRDIFFDNERSFEEWFDIGPLSTKKWVELQDERKFDRFKDYIIGDIKIMERLKVKLGSVTDAEVKTYLYGQYKLFRDCKEYYDGKRRIEWGGVHLVRALNLRVCPYCNRNFIDVYYEKDTFKTKAQFDHFTPKEKYTYLAISLYNLIPSCYTCNHIKSKQDEAIIYPYDKKDGGFSEDAVFIADYYTDEDEIKIENGENIKEIERFDIDFLSGNSNNFKVNFKMKNPGSSKAIRIEKSIDILKLLNLYNLHKDYVKEIAKKAHIYNREKITELYESFPDLFKTKEEVIQMVLANYVKEEDMGKRPLAKLIKDISDEFMDLE